MEKIALIFVNAHMIAIDYSSFEYQIMAKGEAQICDQKGCIAFCPLTVAGHKHTDTTPEKNRVARVFEFRGVETLHDMRCQSIEVISEITKVVPRRSLKSEHGHQTKFGVRS